MAGGWVRASALTGILVMIAAWLLASPPASAHTVSNHYAVTWDASDRAVNWSFVQTGWPSENHKNRVRESAATWSSLGQSMTYLGEPEYAFYNYACTNPVTARPFQKDGMHWTTIDGPGGFLAFTHFCIYSNGILLHDIQVRFDKETANWYSGLGPILPIQRDLRSVATHELGHGTGFGAPAPFPHFDGSNQGEICPAVANANEETMCAVYIGGDINWRTLDDHDIHTFSTVY